MFSGSQFSFVGWLPNVVWDYFVLYEITTNATYSYDVTPRENDIYEITVRDTLSNGVYCFVQGDPLLSPVSVSHWCFSKGRQTTNDNQNEENNEGVQIIPSATLQPTVNPITIQTQAAYALTDVNQTGNAATVAAAENILSTATSVAKIQLATIEAATKTAQDPIDEYCGDIRARLRNGDYLDFVPGSLHSGCRYDGDFFGLDLSDSNFTNTTLISVNLSGTNLKGADYSRATLEQVDFSSADLTDTIFTGALITDPIFTNTNLDPLVLSDAILIYNEYYYFNQNQEYYDGFSIEIGQSVYEIDRQQFSEIVWLDSKHYLDADIRGIYLYREGQDKPVYETSNVSSFYKLMIISPDKKYIALHNDWGRAYDDGTIAVLPVSVLFPKFSSSTTP